MCLKARENYVLHYPCVCTISIGRYNNLEIHLTYYTVWLSTCVVGSKSYSDVSSDCPGEILLFHFIPVRPALRPEKK